MNGPLHLVRRPGDRWSICGIKDPLPVMWADKAHMVTHLFDPCPTCHKGDT